MRSDPLKAVVSSTDQDSDWNHPACVPMGLGMRQRSGHRRQLWCVLAVLVSACASLMLPATSLAVIQVTKGGSAGPVSPPSVDGFFLLANDANGDDAVITFVPNAPGDASDDQLIITSSEPITANAPCLAAPADPRTAVCQLSLLSEQTWVIVGNSGDDQLTVAGPPPPAGTRVYLIGGDGDDHLTGGAGAEHFYGGDGDDTIADGLGNDVIYGEAGNDTLLQSPLGVTAPDRDRDTIDLGDGTADTVSYAAREASNAVTIGASGTWGTQSTPSENDTAAGVEHVVGTPGNDRFAIPTALPTARFTFDGGAGNDTFIPGPTAETFYGGPGIDTVNWRTTPGGAGVNSSPDRHANDGNDPAAPDNVWDDIERVLGSPGPDNLTAPASAGCLIAGGAGNDVLNGPGGGCVLEGGDGADTINGGSGNDTVRPGASGTSDVDTITFGGGYDVIDYATESVVPGVSGISGVQASAAPGAAVWCYSLGVGATSARKFVAGQEHLDHYVDAPEHMIGTMVADTLCGGGSGTTIEGRDGNDVLIGGAGNDVLHGQDGNDLLNGQAGADHLFGGEGSDNLNGGAGNDHVDGEGGDDSHVRGGGGSDTILGGPGNDVLDEVAFSTIMQGTPGDELDGPDVLDGGPGIDRIDGGAGDDVMACTDETLQDTWTDSGGGVEVLDCSALPHGIAVTVGAGIDRVIGTAHGDTLAGAPVMEGGPGNDLLIGGEGPNTLLGGDGNDTLRGGAGDDTLAGGSGDDMLFGEAGDDVLDGGSGGDVLSGGSGVETISYANRGGPVVVTVGDGSDDGQAGEGDSVQDDIEVLIGTRFDDQLFAGSTGITLQGGAGNDVLVGSPQADTLEGGDGNDRLVGGAGANVLHGGAGNDSLLGGRDADQLWGDDGNDVLDGGLGKDLLVGGSGIDTVSYATRRKPVIVGIGIGRWNDGERREGDHIGNDVENLVGGRGNDRLTGSARGNVIRGGAGRDTIDGGKGNDRLYGGAGNDRITGGAGNDRMYGEAGNDQLRAGDVSARDKRHREIVDGGAGKKDSAVIDSRDRTIRVERTSPAKNQASAKRRARR